MVNSRDKLWWLEVKEELQGGGLAHGNHLSSPCPHLRRPVSTLPGDGGAMH